MSQECINYVAGFAFSHDRKSVALIRKEKPEWQKGFLNGVGGKIEKNEASMSAMIREFQEETGADERGWLLFCTLTGKTKDEQKWKVDFYKAFMDLSTLQSTTEEKIEIIEMRNLSRTKVIFNLRWLLNLALDNQVWMGEIFCG